MEREENEIEGQDRADGKTDSSQAGGAGGEDKGGPYNPTDGTEQAAGGIRGWLRGWKTGHKLAGQLAPVQDGGPAVVREVRRDGDADGRHGGDDPYSGDRRNLGHCTLVAWVQVNKRLELYGADASFWCTDPWGMKIWKEAFPRTIPEFKYIEHACQWGVAVKQSTSCPVPPPRAVCKCGFVAPVRGEEWAKEGRSPGRA